MCDSIVQNINKFAYLRQLVDLFYMAGMFLKYLHSQAF